MRDGILICFICVNYMMEDKTITLIVICVCVLGGFVEYVTGSNTSDECKLSVWPKSITYFQSRLSGFKPNFVHFNLRLNSTYNETSDVFRPLAWVWTYKSPNANYPFLSWNIDYGLLSFGLLDSKTTDIEFVKINVSEKCNLTIGEIGTSRLISTALTELIQNISTGGYRAYELSNFCYHAVDESIKHRFVYLAAMYLNYPVTYLNYVCCRETFLYTNDSFSQDCDTGPHPKWEQSVFGPYILGLFLFMYFPIILFQVCAWLVKDEVDIIQPERRLNSVGSDDYEMIDDSIDDWLYLDGNPPISVTDFMQFALCNLGQTHPIIMSKIRRIICIVLAPSFIYIQLAMYRKGIGLTQATTVSVRDLVKKGVPMGFLALLGDKEDQAKVFAPYFGGPMCILFMFFGLSILFLVVPRSLKNIVERGMPVYNMASPLCLDADEIIRLSMYRISPAPGYEKGYAVCKSSIYMLFSNLFWKRVLTIQYQRTAAPFDKPVLVRMVTLVLFPFYIIFCFLEILLCIIFYGIPVVGFVTIMVKGAVKSLGHIRRVMVICSNPLFVLIGTCVALTAFLFFVYSVGLIFIQSFSFVCQVFIFCFISVIIYPSVAFGYLFFCVVMLYYFVRLMKDFGGGYLELLSIAVERSQEMYMNTNNISFFDGQLVLSNVRVNGIRSIRINDMQIDVAQNVLQRLHRENETQKINELHGVYGIPRSLFDYLVQEHRPVHIQVLKLFFHLCIVILLIVVTLGITSNFASGTTSEISDVMHVIFIVTVGALPRVIEVAWLNSNETVMRDIETRCIERSIMEYWTKKADTDSDSFVSVG